MKSKNAWELNVKFNYQNDINKILDFIRKNKIIKFNICDEKGLYDGKASHYFINILNSKAKEQNMEITYFDENNPFFEYNNTIFFNNLFYEKYKKEINNSIIENIISKSNCFVSKFIYNEELLDKLILNCKKIEFDGDIKLSDEEIRKLKDNHIDSYSFKDGNKIEYSSDKFLGYDYNELINKQGEINISSDIKDLENLYLIPDNCTIAIKKPFYDLENEEKYFNDSYNIISELRRINKNNMIKIIVENKKIYEKSKLFKSDLDFYLENDFELYKSSEFKEESNLLDMIAFDIKNSDMSPFEKFLSVYNITKKFKEYKENLSDKESSRDLKKFLNNDYMVCVGYAKLLEELCSRIGINTYNYSVLVDTSYDDGFSVEEKTTELAGHARLIIKINDPKYNLNGYYVSDPTWDNNLNEDYYNHCLMNFDKVLDSDRYFKLTDEDLIMDIKSMDQLNEKYKTFEKLKNRNSLFKLPDNDKYTLSSYTYKVKDILSYLEPNLYNELVNKYPSGLTDNEESMENFITDASRIFIQNRADDVSLDTIMDAASVVNKRVFGFNDEQAKEYKNMLYERNLERDKRAFPYHYESYYEKKVS